MKNSITPYRSLALKALLVPVVGTFTGAALHAATINQTTNGSAQVGWNDTTLWGGSAPTAGNDYQLVAPVATATTDAVVNGTTWAYTSMVRTAGTGGGANQITTTFGGDRLIIPANTRLLGKNWNSTTTVNAVLNGGYINYAPDGGSTNNSATLAGTISFGTANLGALFMVGNTNFTLNVTSAISGSAAKTLQLSMANSNTRTNVLNITGDLSNFFGTIYAGVAATNTSPTSSFSIQSNAVNATLKLDAASSANFRYNLGSANQTFGSVVLNPNAVSPINLVAGQTYNSTQLNDLLGGGSNQFFGTGSITVVPEPGTTAAGVLLAVGALVRVIRQRNRQKA